jgi:hypothetical protein
MTFEEILDQVLTMLQRRGRVSYRTVTRQFALDEAGLDDLKEAILFTYPQAVDEAGRGLCSAATGRTLLSGSGTPPAHRAVL